MIKIVIIIHEITIDLKNKEYKTISNMDKILEIKNENIKNLKIKNQSHFYY